MKDLTQERLKELLDYDPATGLFVRKGDRGGHKAGSVAGCLNQSGYILLKVDGPSFKAHRLAFLFMEGSLPPEDVDHINHDRADNRWSNIRAVTRRVNARHCSMNRLNVSGAAGVRWRENDGFWVSQITVDGKQIHLGTTTDKDEAIRWRKAAEVKYGFSPYHGQPLEAFARLDKSAFAYIEEYA